MYTLGIHGDLGKSGHDAAAVLIKDGNIIAAAEEERFVRYKHAVGLLPTYAIKYCLKEAGITMYDVDEVAFPRTSWSDFKPRFEAYLSHTFGCVPSIQYVDHHTAHAASAYLVSGFDRALVVSIDQAGDGLSGAVFEGRGGELHTIRTFPFPHSVGLFAAFVTQYLGFKSNHDEYKVMGLSSYGTPTFDLSNVLTFKNGSPFFDETFLHPTVLLRHPLFHTSQLPMVKNGEYPGWPSRRTYLDELSQEHKNFAASAQKQIESVILAILSEYKSDHTHLCLAGGVAENSVANGKIAIAGMFKDIYIPPAVGDAGSALGAALYVSSKKGYVFPRMESNKFGPSYSSEDIESLLKAYQLPYRISQDVAGDTAEILADKKIVAWYQGRMEFGPRALGGRSILADPSSEEMKKRVNNIKKREQFRPFAPSVLSEHTQQLFGIEQVSPFMSFTLPATELGRNHLVGATHIDYTGRLQTVPNDGSLYRKLIEAFYTKTGVPALLNTSLNSGWEPIVESPAQAIAFFYSSEADVLVMGDYILQK